MNYRLSFTRYLIIGSAVLGIAGILLYFFHAPFFEKTRQLYNLLGNHDQMQDYISSFGAGAPLVFMLFQIMQVIFAPVPGEATGFIGGYLFGTMPGFIYSSLALTIGSCFNFLIGRRLGIHFVGKWISAKKINKFEKMTSHRGITIIFLLFLIPGFPKDYLCLFLGITTLPLKIFIFLAGIGRIPGTLLLSLQGASLCQKNYTLLAIVMGLCVLIGTACFFFRHSFYSWAEKGAPARYLKNNNTKK